MHPMVANHFMNSRMAKVFATHSPILLAYPGATIYSCDGDTLTTCAYEDTEHYRLTKQFLNNPEHYLRNLFQK